MKILTALQIRELDKYTIAQEPISSIDLMERASIAFCNWFTEKFSLEKSVTIFAGTGNNGGDGLAISRILKKAGYQVTTYVVGDHEKGSEDFRINLNRIEPDCKLTIINKNKDLGFRVDTPIIIDAIFGTGLNRAAEGIYASTINFINKINAVRVAVDLPSGLYSDTVNNQEDSIIKADFTLTFHLPKLSFLFPENEKFVGHWQKVDIGLDHEFIDRQETPYEVLEESFIKPLVKVRAKFSHKGTFGHALIMAGSYGKMGAAVLAARACLKSGVGLLTTQIPKLGYDIMQICVPEAMAVVDISETVISQLPKITNYDAIGIGPGIGKSEDTKKLLVDLLNKVTKSIVMDADALNLLAENKHLLNLLPMDSILTPHPKEFERLSIKATDSLQRLELLKEFSIKHKCITILKGSHTAICTPQGKIYFNSTGNSGMATGGSGDVLTGIITGLLAQGYTSFEAAILGVYMHGYAGDKAAAEIGEESMIASDIIDNLFSFFKYFAGK